MKPVALRPEQIRRPGRPEAAAVCFEWQADLEAAREEEKPSEAAAARKRGLTQVVITASLAGLLYFFLSEDAGTIVAGIACVLLVASMAFPLSVYAAIEGVVSRIALGLQRGVTWFLMGAIFFCIFFPFSMMFRKGRKDKLKRWMEPEFDSYWNDRAEPISAESRKRLY